MSEGETWVGRDGADRRVRAQNVEERWVEHLKERWRRVCGIEELRNGGLSEWTILAQHSERSWVDNLVQA